MSRKKSNHTGLKVFLILLCLLFIAGSAFMIKLSIDLAGKVPEGSAPGDVVIQLPTAPTETDPPETTLPIPEHVVATATISSTGDILMHMPVVNTGRQSEGNYNFDSIFKYNTFDTSTIFKSMITNRLYALRNIQYAH